MAEKPILKQPNSKRTETSPSSPVPTVSSAKQVVLPSISNPRDLDRLRAESAWSSIHTFKETQSEKICKKYGTLARQMPTYIQINGLGQSLAFLKAKNELHHQQVLQHITDWFCRRYQWDEESTDLLKNLLDMSSQQYRLATSEALAFLQWLKRFAEAELGSEEDK